MVFSSMGTSFWLYPNPKRKKLVSRIAVAGRHASLQAVEADEVVVIVKQRIVNPDAVANPEEIVEVVGLRPEGVQQQIPLL